MGGATSHLPAWTGAGWRTDYPWVPDLTLAEGYEWAFVPLRHHGIDIEGTLKCWAIVHSESGEVAVDWSTPGAPAAVAEMMPTRDQVRYLQALLMLLAWIRESSGQGYYNGGVLHNGTTSNRQTIGPFTLVSASGKQVTFNSGASDLRNVSIGTTSGTVGPFDQLRFSSNSVVAIQVLGLIKRVVSAGTGAGSNVTVELLQDVSEAATSTDGNPVTVTIEAEYIPEPWTHVREFNPLWTIWEGMEASYDEAEAGLLTLTRALDGTTGKIAVPREEAASSYGDCVTPATVSVRVVGTDGVVDDVTDSTLARWNSTYDGSGDVISTFDGSGLLTSGERLLLRYRMEVDGGWASNPKARVTGYDRCKFACRSACDQFSFCAKSRDGTPPDGLDDFPAGGDCHQWDCSGWAEDEPFDWRSLGALLNQMVLGVPLVEQQLVAGVPSSAVLKRHGVSGLAWLAGQGIAALDSGQAEISYPEHGVWGDGAFFLDSLAGTAEYGAESASDLAGLLSDGTAGTSGLGTIWANGNDPTRGHRCLLRTDRIGTAGRETLADTFGGRGPDDRPRVRGFVSAAVHCVHAEDGVETNESGQVAFTSNADGTKTLRVLPLGTPFEGDGATIATGDVAAASDLGGGEVEIEPSNKSTPIAWLDTSSSPAFFNTGTADLGAPGNGVVSCHPAYKITDSGSGQGTAGTQLEGAIPGDWVSFSGVSGDDSALIEGRKWLVKRCDPFGGGSQGWNFNGTGAANDPPADWTGARPSNFGTWGKLRSTIVLEDDDDGTLAANVANLVGADITVSSGGVLTSVTSVAYRGETIDTADWSATDPYEGEITVAADAGGDTDEEGWYTISCVAMDRRNIPQNRAFAEVVGGIEALEEVEITVAMTGLGFDLAQTCLSRHAEEFGEVGDAVIDQGEVDFSAQFMAAQTGSYVTNNERHGWSDGTALEDSGASSYQECPAAGETARWLEIPEDRFLVRTSEETAGTFGGTATLEMRTGAQVGDNDGARRWRRVITRSIPNVRGMPAGMLRAVPSGTTILEAKLNLTVTGVTESRIEVTKSGANASSPYETFGTPVITSSTSSSGVSLELWAEDVAGTRIIIAGVGGITCENETQEVDVTSIIQEWIDNWRGQRDWVALYWVPGYGTLSDFTSLQLPARTGTKLSEYTGCQTNSTPPPTNEPVQRDIAELDAANDYTDTDVEITLSGFSISDMTVRVALEEGVREMRQPYNTSTGARRDLRNP